MVLDTNVVVSAHLNADGYERHVLDLVLAGKLQLVASEPILAEYEGVLLRPKFGIRAFLVKRSMRAVRATARMVRPQHKLALTRDPDDNPFLECAEASRADYLVTGNKRHFPRQWKKTLVVNSKELLEWIVPELRR